MPEKTSSSEPRELAFPQALLAWAMLFLVLISALALGANRPVWWTLLAIGVLPLFTLQILLDLFRGLPFAARRAWMPALLYIAVLCWALLQTLPGAFPSLSHPYWGLVPEASSSISADPIAGRHHVMRLATYGMVFWIAMRAATNPDRGMAMLKVIALFSSVLALFGLYASWSGWNPVLGDDNSHPVVSATFMNRNSYVTYAMFGLVTNLAVYLHLVRNRSGKNSVRAVRDFLESFFAGAWIFAAGTLLCLTAIALTQSRAGNAAALTALLTFLLILRRRESGIAKPLLITFFIIACFGALAAASGLLTRVLSTSGDSIRFTVYPIIAEGILDRPWLGHGLGAFHDTFRAYLPLELSRLEFALAHNSYLENAWELGLPAAVAFYLALFWVIGINARGTMVRRRQRSFACVVLAVSIGAGLHSLFDFSLQMPATAALFAVLLGLGWAQSFRRRKRRPR